MPQPSFFAAFLSSLAVCGWMKFCSVRRLICGKVTSPVPCSLSQKITLTVRFTANPPFSSSAEPGQRPARHESKNCRRSSFRLQSPLSALCYGLPRGHLPYLSHDRRRIRASSQTRATQSTKWRRQEAGQSTLRPKNSYLQPQLLSHVGKFVRMALFPVLKGFLVKRAEVLIGSYLLGALFAERSIAGAGWLVRHSPVAEEIRRTTTGAIFWIVLGGAVP